MSGSSCSSPLASTPFWLRHLVRRRLSSHATFSTRVRDLRWPTSAPLSGECGVASEAVAWIRRSLSFIVAHRSRLDRDDRLSFALTAVCNGRRFPLKGAQHAGRSSYVRRKARCERCTHLWITAGLGCDGDSVSVTAAEQPSIEDVVMGAIPGLPKVHLHNPVLAYEVGDDFMKYFYQAERGELDPFVLVVEGSIPNEDIKDQGYWAAMGTDPNTGQPITTCEWIDRLAPKALGRDGGGTCATYGGIHAMAGNPTGAMGLADYLGWDWRSKAGLPIVNVPGCPVQPDNFMETVLYLFSRLREWRP